ncbi:hypothetical protein D3C74_391500 [compost metagenome]
MAPTTAFNRKARYVRLTPSFCINSCLILLRSCTRLVTSTSIIIQPCGISDTLWRIRVAIVLRIGVTSIKYSERSPPSTSMVGIGGFSVRCKPEWRTGPAAAFSPPEMAFCGAAVAIGAACGCTGFAAAVDVAAGAAGAATAPRPPCSI